MPRWLLALKHVRRLPEVVRCSREVQDWWPLTRAYLGIGRSSYPLDFRAATGVRLSLRDQDEVVTAWVVFCREEYVVPVDCHTILDVGANYGAFTVRAAATAPDASIISLEPFADTFGKLQENIEMNGLSERVECWQLAVAARAGTRRMSLSAGIKSHSRELLPAEGDSREPTTHIETIGLGEMIERARESFASDQIDLVKMDVEGAEHEILQAASPGDLSAVRQWQMEYHPRGPKHRVFGALARGGMKCVKDVRLGPDYGVAHFRRSSV
ncbi:MAG: FkbM family methyltransferase [Planctomycetes bacterium]|nr:FkbM family methyltransferase [Planctomycetota bacterium]